LAHRNDISAAVLKEHDRAKIMQRSEPSAQFGVVFRAKLGQARSSFQPCRVGQKEFERYCTEVNEVMGDGHVTSAAGITRRSAVFAQKWRWRADMTIISCCRSVHD
jgi:hypothetical protein